jgi:ABC-2 type transport system permease protein
MSEFLSTARGVAWRGLHVTYTNPAFVAPSIIFPLFFYVAFAGGLSSVGDVPGFSYPAGYDTFQFAFVLLQAAAFGGVFSGFGIAADFEQGFGRRLLLASPRRRGIIAGYVLAAIARWCFPTTIVSVAATIAGMDVDGSVAQLVALVSLALLVNMTATMWGVGMALRFQTLQAGPAMQIPVFLILFMAPVYVPLDLIRGWVHDAASYNPLTALVESGRGFISGVPDLVGIAYLAGFGLVALGLVWAVTGLRRAERGV